MIGAENKGTMSVSIPVLYSPCKKFRILGLPFVCISELRVIYISELGLKLHGIWRRLDKNLGLHEGGILRMSFAPNFCEKKITARVIGG